MENGHDLVALRAQCDTGGIIEVVAQDPMLVGDLIDRLGEALLPVTALPDDIRDLLEKVNEVDAKSRTEIADNVPKLLLKGDEDRAYWVDDVLPRVMGWQKYADETRARLKRPFLDGGAQVDNLFRNAIALLATIVRRIKDADNSYRRELEAARLKAAAEAQRAQQARHVDNAINQAAKLEEQGEHGKAAEVLQRASDAPAPPVTTAGPPVSKLKNSSVTKRWKYEITDPQLVPREYCAPSDKLIKAQVDTFGDKADIPGVRVFLDEDLATRAIRPAAKELRHAE